MEDRNFKSQSFAQKGLPAHGFQNCVFESCDFSNLSLTEVSFVDCDFISCNFTGVQLGQTAFKDVRFEQCKLLGLPFKDCKPFLLQMQFKHCNMELCSFFKLDASRTLFESCQLIEADFAEAILREAIFKDCDLSHAIFDQSNLEKADFCTASHFQINPNQNKLKGARFSAHNTSGLLSHFDIVIEN